MADPLIPIETIRYKTYVKQTLVQALRTVFENHPDPILANTKVTIDFPMTQVSYPALVIRFYESDIKNAGVAHQEWIPRGGNNFADYETWFDPFAMGIRTALDYRAKAGEYNALGSLIDVATELMPYAPEYQYGLDDIGHAVHLRVTRLNNEHLVVRGGIVSSLDNSVSFICEGEVEDSTLTARIIYRDADGNETVILEAIINGMPSTGVGWGVFKLDAAGELSFQLLNYDPFKPETTESDLQITYTATATTEQLDSITDTNTRYWHGGVNYSFDPETDNPDEASRISLFRTLKSGMNDQKLYKFKHYLYHGDIEFAIYALSSYDRDLIADTVVQTLSMGDLQDWTNNLLDRIYHADATEIPTSIDHMINLNTDEIQGFGESQQLAPWLPEDVMVYQTSYRINIFGEFYSMIPVDRIYGLIENIEFYPYLGDNGEPVPEPDWSGPDKIQGTEDDQPDPGVWE